jgi:hypothetical protein
MGRTEAALRIQLGAVNRLSPDVSADDTEARMSVYGIVVLQAAMAAARNGDTATVTDLFREADDVATHLGRDTDHYRASFGPTNHGLPLSRWARVRERSRRTSPSRPTR